MNHVLNINKLDSPHRIEIAAPHLKKSGLVVHLATQPPHTLNQLIREIALTPQVLAEAGFIVF